MCEPVGRRKVIGGNQCDRVTLGSDPQQGASDAAEAVDGKR